MFSSNSKSKSNLIYCSATALTADGLPTKVHLLPLGRWKGYRKPGTAGQIDFEITKELAASAVAYHERRKAKAPERDLVIDYEHQSLVGGIAPAAGWIDHLSMENDGAWGTIRFWTEEAQRLLKDRAYRYLSPVFAFDQPDPESGESIPLQIVNAGLTNDPFFDTLTPLVAKAQHHTSLIISGKDTTMDELLQWLRSFLNLPLSSTVEDILAEMQKLADKIKAETGAATTVTAKAILDTVLAFKNQVAGLQQNYAGIMGALSLEPTAQPEAARAVIAARSDMTMFVAKAEHERIVGELQGKLVDRDVSDFLAAAQAAGKITPATTPQIEAWARKDLVTCKAYVDALPANSAIPMGAITTGVTASGDKIDDATKSVASRLNVSEDSIKKFGK